MRRLSFFSVSAWMFALVFAALGSNGLPQQKNSDIDEIGRRDINKHQINFMSLEKEIALGKQLGGQIVLVIPIVHHFRNPGIQHQLGADTARVVGDVNCCFTDANSKNRGLDDGVLLCVHAPAKLVALAAGHVHLLADATDLGAVLDAFGRAVVAGREDSFIFHNDGTDFPPEACRTCGNQVGHFHEVFVHGGPCDFCHARGIMRMVYEGFLWN